MHVSVRKKQRHLAQKSVKKLVGLLARRIERRLKNSCATLNLVRAGGTADLRITDLPACAVTGNIKLGHYANAALTSKGNDLAHLVLRVEETIGTQRMESGKSLALHAK